MKDEEAIDWRERFSQFPLNKENKFKENKFKEGWSKSRGKNCLWYLVYFFLGKRRRMSVWKEN